VDHAGLHLHKVITSVVNIAVHGNNSTSWQIWL